VCFKFKYQWLAAALEFVGYAFCFDAVRKFVINKYKNFIAIHHTLLFYSCCDG
jgi:hypothetical protein